MSTLKVDTITDEAGTGAPTLSQGLNVDGGTIKLDGNYPVGTNNVALGYNALIDTTSGSNNTSVGADSPLGDNTTGSYNAVMGTAAMRFNTTGSNNVAIGYRSLISNTTASNNTAVGYQAGYSNTVSGDNTFIGWQAGYSRTGSGNTIVGQYAGRDGTTGVDNTLIGRNAGYTITSGSNNTILGMYNGNQSGLDIRTSSNNIVLSDGDGNVAFRGFSGNAQRTKIGVNMGSPSSVQVALEVERHDANHSSAIMTRHNTTTSRHHIKFHNSNGEQGYIVCNTSSVSYVTTSDYRLKENVVELTGATDRLKQLNPSRFNFIADADTTVDGFIAHEVQSVVPEAVTGTKDAVDADGNPEYQGIDQSKLVPLLVATIKELEARITALEAN